MSKLVIPGSINFAVPTDSTAESTAQTGRELLVEGAKLAAKITTTGLATPPGILLPTSDDMVKATESRGALSEETQESIKEAVKKNSWGHHGPASPASAGGMGVHPSSLHAKLPVIDVAAPLAGHSTLGSFNSDFILDGAMPGIVRASTDDLKRFATPMAQADRRELFDKFKVYFEELQKTALGNLL